MRPWRNSSRLLLPRLGESFENRDWDQSRRNFSNVTQLQAPDEETLHRCLVARSPRERKRQSQMKQFSSFLWKEIEFTVAPSFINTGEKFLSLASETCINSFRDGITINYEWTRKYHRGSELTFASVSFLRSICFQFLFLPSSFPLRKFIYLHVYFQLEPSDNLIHSVDEQDVRRELKLWRLC